jgi:aminoglycoside phosphotransferase (APT) family kinase protein
LVIDAELVRRLVGAQFPQWAALPIRIVDPGGWDNRTFRLGETMAARLPSRAAYAPQVLKEQQWLPRLAPTLPLPIPTPLALGAPCAEYPWPWSIYAWLPGERADLAHLPDRRHFAGALAGFLNALQDIDPGGAPPPGTHNAQRGGSLRFYDEETHRAIVLLGSRIDSAAATRVWAAALAAPYEGPPVWLHGDISLGNLLVERGALSAVIDWGCAAVGDPACDLAIAWSSWGAQATETFKSACSVDPATWQRARGWTLWKALVVLAGLSGAHAAAKQEAGHVLREVLADD